MPYKLYGVINHCNPILMPGQTDRRRGRAGPAFDQVQIGLRLNRPHIIYVLVYDTMPGGDHI